MSWSEICWPRPTPTGAGSAAFCGSSAPDISPGERERAGARKRGGGKTALSIDVADAEGRYSREPSHELTPERIFDRTWALTLLGRVFDQLRSEYDAAGRAAIFDELRTVLTGASQLDSYATIALRLGTSEGAIRVAVHRLRRRYGVLLRQEIAATVDDPEPDRRRNSLALHCAARVSQISGAL